MAVCGAGTYFAVAGAFHRHGPPVNLQCTAALPCLVASYLRS